MGNDTVATNTSYTLKSSKQSFHLVHEASENFSGFPMIMSLSMVMSKIDTLSYHNLQREESDGCECGDPT